MKTRLILDTNYLCHRAWYSFGTLRKASLGTGVLFGVLKDIIDLQDRFQPDCFIFCFDKGKLFREVDYPNYKMKRKLKYQNNETEKFFKKERDKQIKELRLGYLPQLGYQNIFYRSGYEADDCIARVLELYGSDHGIQHIIVSADHDLYQLLGRRVSIYKPAQHELYTEQMFSKEFGVTPSQWVDVKSIAGCDGDDIEGIPGIAEKTASKFISGNLPSHTKAFKTIVKNNDTWQANRHLVRLPYPGLPKFKVVAPEALKKGSWRHLAAKLDMKTIQDKEPKKKGGFGIV